jgi:hypothetical protein
MLSSTKINSLGKLLAPTESDTLSGDIGFDETLLEFFKEEPMTRKTRKKRTDEPIIMSGLRKPNRTHLDGITDKAAASMTDIDISRTTTFDASEPTLAILKGSPGRTMEHKDQLEDDIDGTINAKFVEDFEHMLDWQSKLDNEAISSLGGIETYLSRSIPRYSREDSVSLILNLFLYLKEFQGPLVSDEISEQMFETFCIYRLIIDTFTSEQATAQDLKTICLSLSQNTFIELKALTSHLKR